MTDNEKMREAVLKILASYKQEMERYGYYSSNPGVSVDDFEEIADEIVAWQAARTVPEGFVMVPVDLLDKFPELNEFNYSHDDVCELNAWGIDLVLSAAPEPKK